VQNALYGVFSAYGGGGGGSNLVPAGGEAKLTGGGPYDEVEPSVTISYTLPPVVGLNKVSEVTTSSVRLNGVVNPESSEIKECEFEYGTTRGLGSTVPCAQHPGSGTSNVFVNAHLHGLQPNTFYYVRISATNKTGTTQSAPISGFRTPPGPVVGLNAISELTTTTVRLNGVVNPEGSPVKTCSFEYGTTPALGTTTPCAKLPGGGTSNVFVYAHLTGLEPGTLYYVRITATNTAGTGTSSPTSGFRTEILSK
jgi:phosphodiesterase/alkaline phosphatase D-like protein